MCVLCDVWCLCALRRPSPRRSEPAPGRRDDRERERERERGAERAAEAAPFGYDRDEPDLFGEQFAAYTRSRLPRSAFISAIPRA